MPGYDTTPYIDPAYRVPGFHDAYCRIRWEPADGGPEVVVAGGYLDGSAPDGAVSLGCGIEQAVSDLGISDLLDDVDHIVAVADLVTRQLAGRPWARLTCPQGTATIDLLSHPGESNP